MGKQFGRKQAGLKRPKTTVRFDARKQGKKNRHTEEKLAYSPPPRSSDIEDSLEEHLSSIASEEEEVVYKEPSIYDNLLRSLGSCSESLATIYKRRRKEEEGKSDSEEGENESELEDNMGDGPKSLRVLEEEDDGDEGEIRDSIVAGDVEQDEVAENEDGKEGSDTDREHEFRVNVLDVGASESTSSFNMHLVHKLSQGEIEKLTQRKWKYRWEELALGMPSCKWMGSEECFLKDVNRDSAYGLKLKLYKHWLNVYNKAGGNDFHLSRQRLFYTLCDSYRDVLLYNKKPFYLKGLEEDSNVMDAYIMHSLNHIFKTRDLVTKNDAKMAKQEEIAKDGILTADGFLDQGFTRPKVLILLPLASVALRLIKRLIQLTPSSHKVNVEHQDRFCDEFGIGVAEGREDNEFNHSNSQRSSKPSDFQALFGGNNNDHFMIGIKFTRRSIKLYSDFYSSDIIVASPLGLKIKIEEAEIENEKDVDYLSSIEVLIIDHADVIAMQNWSHVCSVVEQLNHIPSKQHGTNVMRIRKWYLDGQAQFYRQTIILGFYLNPDMNALFNNHCLNFHGKVKLVCEYKGVLPKVLLQVRQIYERFDADSIVDADDARLEYFSKKVFPKIKDSIQGGIMLFVSSYFEFIRLRNFLKSHDASFCLLGDYQKQSDISRARVWFFEGKRKIMLYTERAHFYHRYKIRGIKNLIIYSLPGRKEFYPEILNMLEGSQNMACTVLFSRFDQLQLERIVGTTAAKRMATSEKGVFVFC